MQAENKRQISTNKWKWNNEHIYQC